MYIAQCIHDFSTSYGLPASLFLGGLVGGVTHCAGMCSPFVIAQAPQGGTTLTRTKKSLLLPYHLGRMTTYVAMAVALNGFVNLAFLYSDMKGLIAAPLLMLAGVLFFVTAFPQLARLFPWAARVRLRLPYAFMNRMMGHLSNDQTPVKRYGMGVLLGFMPCGLVMAALMAAASAPSIFDAAIAMSAFTFGTMPALIMVALGASSLQNKFPRASAYIKQGAMALSGIWLFVLAGTLVF